MKRLLVLFLLVGTVVLLPTCKDKEGSDEKKRGQRDRGKTLLSKYQSVKLTTDLTVLSENERRMIPLLIAAADEIDKLFWKQAFGDNKSKLIEKLDDKNLRAFARINYGPWDRLNENKPFTKGYGKKSPGANFYPKDMTKEEFEAANLPDKTNQYTLIRRGDKGKLKAVWYHDAYTKHLEVAAAKLREAAALAEDAGLKNYLLTRADALMSDDFYESDIAWLDMKDNTIDIVIGPIETYEDQLFGYKASYTAYILVKDKAWSARLAKYAAMLPWLQSELPVTTEYKREQPGTDSDLNAYDVIYYAGDCNAASKTIAINLPNDERVQLEKGTRRLQLKNAMRAKYDHILAPMSNILITEEQRHHVTFDAFFSNTMFHEVAHGLGIKNTITGKGTVKDALKDLSAGLEEGKADILGLYMITRLHEKGEMGEADLMDYYVTFLAGIFRSSRFGKSSAHGNANMIRFNYFNEMNAFTRDGSGRYRVNFTEFQNAITSLSERILRLQGDGDYEAVKVFVDKYGVLSPQLEQDLARVSKARIPVDVVFEQGLRVLGLE